MNSIMSIRRGDIFMAKLEANGSVQGGVRPVVVWSNNVNNRLDCPIVNIFPISSQINKNYPMHVKLVPGMTGLDETSIALCEQIQTINKSQLQYKLGYVDGLTIRKLEKASKMQQGMIKPVNIHKINEWLYFINECKTKLSESNDEFYRRSLSHAEHELKEYCEEYDLNYNSIIENRVIKEIMFTRNGAVISV